jgi:hypothetical protein
VPSSSSLQPSGGSAPGSPRGRIAAHLTLALEDLAAALRHLRDAGIAEVDGPRAAEVDACRSRVRVQIAECKRLLDAYR